jgi:PAS domain S-box-containing protein
VVRHLLAAFATDTQRLIQAIDGMDHLIDLALSAVGEAYLEAKQEVIARQKEAIGELRSRARYQVILSSIADGVVTTDPFGNVVTVNPALERLSGLKAEEVIGTSYEDAFRVLYGDRYLPWEERHLYRAIAEGRVVHSEEADIRLVRADGTELPVSITSAPIVEEGGRVTGGVNVIRERSTS